MNGRQIARYPRPGSRAWAPAEGAPGRAARSPAIAAVLILLVQNRKGVPNCRKNRMAFDAERPQENQGKNQGYYRPLGQVRQDSFSDRRARAEARVMCYKFEMSKTTERWLLFEYVGGEFTPLSKPFKTREQAEKEREKCPERLRKGIGLGVIRRKK
jgi:hypothetical protein